MKAQQSLVFAHARTRRCVSASARAFCSAPVSSESTKRCTACGRSRQSICRSDLRSLRSGSCTCIRRQKQSCGQKSVPVGRRRAAGKSCSRCRFHPCYRHGEEGGVRTRTSLPGRGRRSTSRFRARCGCGCTARHRARPHKAGTHTANSAAAADGVSTDSRAAGMRQVTVGLSSACLCVIVIS